MKRSTSSSRARGSPAARRSNSARSARARASPGQLASCGPMPGSVSRELPSRMRSASWVNNMSHRSAAALSSGMRPVWYPEVRAIVHRHNPSATCVTRGRRRFTQCQRRHRWQTVARARRGPSCCSPTASRRRRWPTRWRARCRSSRSKAHTIERTFWDTFDGRVHARRPGARRGRQPASRCRRDDLRRAGRRPTTRARRAAAAAPATCPAGALRERLEPLVEMRALDAGRARAQPPAAGQRARRPRQDRRAPARRGADGASPATTASVALRRAAARRRRARLRPRATTSVLALLTGELGLVAAGAARAGRRRRGGRRERRRHVVEAARHARSRRRAPTPPPSRSCAACSRSSRLNLPGHAGRRRHGVPARPARRRAPHARAAARAARRLRARAAARLSRRLQGAAASSPARRATSTSSCSSSTTSPRRCPPTSPATSRRCAGCSRTASSPSGATMVRALQLRAHARAAGQLARLPRRARRRRPRTTGPDAARPVADVAGERIAKVYRRMVKMGARDRRRHARTRRCTTCARRARSCATCSSSSPRCIRPRSSSRWSRR